MNNLVCTVCKKPKNELTPGHSELISSIRLFRCGECLAGKKEPRFAIIMAGRTMGMEVVRPYLRKHRYVGAPILAEEFV